MFDLIQLPLFRLRASPIDTTDSPNSQSNALSTHSLSGTQRRLSASQPVPLSLIAKNTFINRINRVIRFGQLGWWGAMGLVGLVLMGIGTQTAQAGQNALMVELPPALCQFDMSRSRLRQCVEGYHMVVKGLDMGYGSNCRNNKSSTLSPMQKRVLSKIIPDNSQQRQAWSRYGACSPYSASEYFRKIIEDAGKLKLPPQLYTGKSHTVNTNRFRKQIADLNPNMGTNSITLICQIDHRQRRILTEIQICYDETSYKTCSLSSASCGKSFIIFGNK